MVQRVTYRRQCSYNTKSNKVVKVKTPGGRLVVQYPHKRPHLHRQLTGVAANRHKSVSRKYGNHLSGEEVKQRIIRAFLTEEVKIVKKVMNQARAQSKKEKKEQASKQ